LEIHNYVDLIVTVFTLINAHNSEFPFIILQGRDFLINSQENFVLSFTFPAHKVRILSL